MSPKVNKTPKKRGRKTISDNMKRHIIELRNVGQTTKEVAEALDLALSTVSTIYAKRAEFLKRTAMTAVGGTSSKPRVSRRRRTHPITNTTPGAFRAKLKKIIEEGGYAKKQIFNVGKTGLYWKRIMSRTCISRDEKRAKGCKASQDKLTLLLGGNLEGDVKLKPLLVYHFKNPTALKGSKANLPVIWRSNKTSEVTQELFSDYMRNYFCPFLKAYCKKNNLANKALLLIDTTTCGCSATMPTVANYNDNVQFVLLRPNQSSPQPMDQGVIDIFKAYYLKLFMKYLVNDMLTVKDVWKKYNIKVAVEHIATAWDEVMGKTMNGAWGKLVPDAVPDDDFGSKLLKGIVDDIVLLAAKAGFDEVDNVNVHKLLESHGKQEVTNEELMQGEEDQEIENNIQCYRRQDKTMNATRTNISPCIRPFTATSCGWEPQPSCSGTSREPRKRALREPFLDYVDLDTSSSSGSQGTSSYSGSLGTSSSSGSLSICSSSGFLSI